MTKGSQRLHAPGGSAEQVQRCLRTGGRDISVPAFVLQVEVHSRSRGSAFTCIVGVSGTLESRGTPVGNGVLLDSWADLGDGDGVRVIAVVGMEERVADLLSR